MTSNTCDKCVFAMPVQQTDANNQPVIGEYILFCHAGPPTALWQPRPDGSVGLIFPVPARE